jgi:hypothetical protein
MENTLLLGATQAHTSFSRSCLIACGFGDSRYRSMACRSLYTVHNPKAKPRCRFKLSHYTEPAYLDKYAYVLSSLAVQMMPNMIVMCAKRRQEHLSCWRAARAFGIVKETF